ncbi:MAG: NOL1/NOP2/sun family putative RNA methylase [Candidatus Peribacteraceae bacterium]|nr:NOL1/NOP2/sun family putative RNA methylase [Candidatus Peribacteraceae bacterium]
MSGHPFDRYAAYTDLAALNAASAKPLRKSLRVNTLKTSVAAFKAWAEKEAWQLTPVPWCPEGFFVERADRSTALGKDLLHLLGHVYMQEAASMLPVALLDPQPGEKVLDMSAAPGSKTTQIAARMNGTGVVVANDVQEKRLQTLKSALYRNGVPNALLTRKQGQWFGTRMVERFDRVLCDVPCTAQGTVRKDASALEYSSERSIHSMAALQFSLLESAVHAAKVGGRIVYSTCTLTPEENEMVVSRILNKYCEQVTVLDVTEGSEIRAQRSALHQAVKDSMTVQRELQKTGNWSLTSDFSALRLWPQTYDTEGFFCAVLRKRLPTAERVFERPALFQERPIRRREQEKIGAFLTELYGTSFLHEGDQLFELDGQLLLSTEDVQDFPLLTKDYALGFPFAKLLKDGRCRLTHDLAIARGMMATSNYMEMKDEQLHELFAGRDTTCSKTIDGDVILQWQGMAIGIGLAQQGVLKNRISRWLVQLTSE